MDEFRTRMDFDIITIKLRLTSKKSFYFIIKAK